MPNKIKRYPQILEGYLFTFIISAVFYLIRVIQNSSLQEMLPYMVPQAFSVLSSVILFQVFLDLVFQASLDLLFPVFLDLVVLLLLFYPAICRPVKLPPQNSARTKGLGGRSTVHKCPIGEG